MDINSITKLKMGVSIETDCYLLVEAVKTPTPKARDDSSLTKAEGMEGKGKAMVFPVVMYGCESWTVSSVLAWRIPGTGEPGGLPSLGLHRVGHD